MKRVIVSLLMVVVALGVAGCDKPLSVTDVSPKTGTVGGGEPIEIIGTGFHNNMGISVYIGANKTDNVSIAGTEKLLVTTPPGNGPGKVDIRVITDSGEEFLMRDAFTYVEKSDGGAMDIRDLGARKSHRKK